MWWPFAASFGVCSQLWQSVESSYLGRMKPPMALPDCDLTGKNAIVPGGLSGIGLEMTRMLLERGANVTVASRDLIKAAHVRERELRDYSDDRISFMYLDCTSLPSIRVFARQWNKKPLHILMNNAGTRPGAFRITHDGIEQSFQINMLSHYALTMYLLPCMAKNARIVETTSIAQLTGKKLDAEDMDLQDWLLDDRGYARGDRLGDCDNKVVYDRSKTLQVMFCVEFQRRLDMHPHFSSKNIIINAYHPGLVQTEFWTHEHSLCYESARRPPGSRMPLSRNFMAERAEKWGVPAEEGAAGGIYLATAPKVARGSYYNMRGKERVPHSRTFNTELAKKHWAKWHQIVGAGIL